MNAFNSNLSHFFIPGNPDEYEIIQFAKKIKNNLSSKSDIVFLPEMIDDPKKRRPNIEKAIKELSWWPKVSLESGLKSTVNYFKTALSLNEINNKLEL